MRIAVLLLTVLPTALPAQPASDALRKLCDDFMEFRYRAWPPLATFVGRIEYNHLWPDLTAGATQNQSRAIAEFTSRLNAIPRNRLAAQDRITAALLARRLADCIEEDRIDGLLAVGQMRGLHISVFLTVDRMPHRTLRDYENIIARLNGVGVLMDQQIAVLNAALAKGLAQPRPVIDRVLAQLDSQMAPDAAHSPLLAAFQRFPDGIPADARQSLTTRAQEAYDRQFRPAWKRYRAYIAETYAPKARTTAGISGVPGGRAIYEFLIRTTTTTNMTPEEIHNLGKQEVARIEGEMQSIMRQAGFQARSRSLKRS